MEMHLTSDQTSRWKERKLEKTCETKDKQLIEKREAREGLVAPGDTIRSKIEDKLTEEKLIEKRKRGVC